MVAKKGRGYGLLYGNHFDEMMSKTTIVDKLYTNLNQHMYSMLQI
jgi:hypothetical protein